MPNPPFSPAIEALPWQPLRPGFRLKLVRGGASDDDTRALLLWIEPGVEIPPHRHSGEIHAWNLAGTRVLDTGLVIGPGGYVYEPPGNVDSWRAVGDEPVIVFLTARGTIEYLDGGAISSTASVTEGYRRFVEAERAR